MNSNKKLMIIFSGIFIITILSITLSEEPKQINNIESVEKEKVLIENMPYTLVEEEIVFDNQLYNPANSNKFTNLEYKK